MKTHEILRLVAKATKEEEDEGERESYLIVEEAGVMINVMAVL